MTLVGRIRQRTALQLNARPYTVSGGVAFAYGEIGYLLADGTVRLAQSDGTQAEADAVVMCVAAAGVADGASGLFVTGADVPGLSGGTPGSLAYVDITAGALTTTVPTWAHGDRWIRPVGRWLTATILRFFPSLDATPMELYEP
jgi:hypothetical protein